jgi:hypothetical protein
MNCFGIETFIYWGLIRETFINPNNKKYKKFLGVVAAERAKAYISQLGAATFEVRSTSAHGDFHF